MTNTIKILSLLMLIFCATAYADNELFITQAGDNFVLGVEQSGNDNKIQLDIQGTTNRLWATQTGNNNTISWVPAFGPQSVYGGDIGGNYNNFHFEQQCSEVVCVPNNIGFHVSGDSNNVRWGQGVKLDNAEDSTFYWDGLDEGGKTVLIDIHGNSNTVTGWQASSGNGQHTANLYIYSNNNDGYIEQRGNEAKLLNITTYNSDNEFGIIQRDNAAHSADITLTGSAPTILNLVQRNSTTAQSYTLYQDCQTAGGCSVSIIQE